MRSLSHVPGSIAMLALMVAGLSSSSTPAQAGWMDNLGNSKYPVNPSHLAANITASRYSFPLGNKLDCKISVQVFNSGPAAVASPRPWTLTLGGAPAHVRRVMATGATPAIQQNNFAEFSIVVPQTTAFPVVVNSLPDPYYFELLIEGPTDEFDVSATTLAIENDSYCAKLPTTPRGGASRPPAP